MFTCHLDKTDSDFEFIASLFCSRNTQYMRTKRKTPKAIKQSISPTRIHYILSLNKKNIGWFNIQKQIDSDEGRFGMMIDKPHQGKGYGKQAMQLIEKEAERLGIKRLELEVFVENTRAIKLYKKAGFKVTGRLMAMEKKIKK